MPVINELPRADLCDQLFPALPETIFIVIGPTASGKSSLAMDMARRGNGVIINADSQQIYQGLPILSAQPSIDDLNNINHRLYSFLQPDELCDAYRWRELAKAEIQSVLADGKTPILVGGTGLYINALIDGLSPIPDIPEDLRKDITAMIKRDGLPTLFEKLKTVDPAIAERIDQSNTRRVARAWEVYAATGTPLSHWQDMPRQGQITNIDVYLVTLLPERELLRRNCDQRFDMMMNDNVLQEVKALDHLIQTGQIPPNAPATKALGFYELADYCRGDLSLDDAIEKAKAQTRQYAKRQVTWFRNQLPSAPTVKAIYHVKNVI